MTGGDPAGRRRAREAALRMLYQSEVGRASAFEAIATYWPAHDADRELTDAQRDFANNLVRGTLDRIKEIDAILASHAQNWRVERMAVIDRLVLRLAIYELLADPDTPSRVVINEALELARTFSTEESVKFINGMLDAIRKKIESK